jgi:hypothetical protein
MSKIERNPITIDDANLLMSNAEAWNYELIFRIGWVEQFLEAGQKLKNKEQLQTNAEIIFVKGLALITDIRQAIAYHFLAEDMLVIANPELAKESFYLQRPAFSEKILYVINKIENALSTDEMQLLEFLRHRSCHLFTESYLISLHPGTLKVGTKRKSEAKDSIRDRNLELLESQGGPAKFALYVFNRMESEILALKKLLMEHYSLQKESTIESVFR